MVTTAGSRNKSLTSSSPLHVVRDFAALILPAALIATALDAVFAVVAYVFVLGRYSLVGALQYIASGLLGPAAFDGGLVSAGLGVVIHTALAFGFAGLYALAALKIPALRRTRGIVVGLAYGAAIWLAMALLVLPLSAVPPADDGMVFFGAFLLGHALFVGLPIAMLTNARLRRSAVETSL